MLGQAPCKKTFTIFCDPDETIQSFASKLYLKYVENYPETYCDVTVYEFIEDVRFVYAGKKIYGSDNGKIADYRIRNESTLDEHRSFGNPSCSFVIGKERREYEDIRNKDVQAADLLVQCRTHKP